MFSVRDSYILRLIFSEFQKEIQNDLMTYLHESRKIMLKRAESFGSYLIFFPRKKYQRLCCLAEEYSQSFQRTRTELFTKIVAKVINNIGQKASS